MADALVEAGTGLNFGLGRGRNRVVFQNPRGNKYYYSLYVDDSDDLILEYSTDAADWTNAAQTVYTGTVEDFDMKIYDTGTLLDIYVVLYDSAVSDLTYIRGTMGDAASTPTWNADQDIDAAINEEINSLMSVAIARTYNGELVVTFTEDFTSMGKDYRLTKIIGADGDGAAPSWSDETTIDNPSGNNNNENKSGVYVGMESFSSSYPDRVLIYARHPDSTDATSYGWTVWVYDWDGGITTFTSIDSKNIQNGTDWEPLSGIIDDNDKVHVAVYRGSSKDFFYHYYWATAGGLGIMTATQISGSAIDACTLAMDRTNDELYCFYHHTADFITYHYKKTDVGTISWGTEQDETSSAIITHLSSHNSDVESYLHLAYVDNDGDIYYDSLNLAAAGWGHTFNGVAGANIGSVSGVVIANIDKIKGV